MKAFAQDPSRARPHRSRSIDDGAEEPVGPGDAGLESFFPELFRGLSHEALRDLEAEFERVHLTGGETLLRQGELADCMYLVVSGRLRAYVERPDGRETVVGEIARGEIVGEMGLLIDEPRAASIRAVRDSELLRLSKEVFDRFIDKYPLALKQIARVNLMRLRRTILSPRVESTVATIAIVPAGQDAPLSSFAESLVRALDALGPTLHLNKERFERGFGDASGRAAARSNGSVTAWLSEQETKYRYVVYESDGTRSSWTRRCLRQADHVLAVGRGGSDPAIGEAEAEIQPFDWRDRTGRRDLVLLHPDHTDRPTGTQAWLAARHVDGHHHVRMGSRADFDRLARFLTGRAVGLVLGGGGARGMAHIGALKAIRELGIPIDLVGGTSSGALIAGALAKGLDCETLHRQTREQLSGGSLLDFTLPFMSLVSGRRISRILEYAFGDLLIEDLWLSYFCVSSNLSRARMVVHRRGPLRKAVRASISLPGILPPVVEDRDLLVDGGLMNKLPVDVMRGFCNGGKVLAVSVSSVGGIEATDAFGEHVSGWGLLRRRLNPFRPRTEGPNIASIMLCSTLVNSGRAQEALEREADLCVHVTPAPIGLFDYKSLDTMVEAGYQAAMKQLEEWPRSAPASPSVCRTTESTDPGGLAALAEVLHPSI
jgi:NTE family protein/lysophospholipid hydrolase